MKTFGSLFTSHPTNFGVKMGHRMYVIRTKIFPCSTEEKVKEF
jgi:hypothetical protein